MSLYDPNQDWFKKWLRLEPHVIIGGEDDPYLKRWLVVPRNKFPFNIYLHKFCRSDDDRALHDHPWDWWSILLKGGYTEHFEGGSRRRPQFSIAHRRAEEAHRVELDAYCACPDGDDGSGIVCKEKPAWTLFITASKRREWGFHCPKGWMHWEKFTEGGTPTDARNSLGCGELS